MDAHGIHSPFVFDFYNNVIKKSGEINDQAIQELVKKLRKNHNTLEVVDFGAGSKNSSSSSRKISEITKSAAVPQKYGKLLARIIQFYSLENIIELGTSVGISGLYMTQPLCVKKLVTIEGSKEISSLAKNNFTAFGLKNAALINGKFEDHLSESVKIISRPDLVFIDGNHQYQPTLDYFNFYVDKLSENGFIVFDDIYWSDEMENAWKEICASHKINVSMDLFRFGIVCKRPGQAKQHFVLKY
ncbi:MAG: class I SAM-dependent methyltransferase [Crocinitomicaceae bacterium]|nr:class I SAM-dependent methyltransferase [Crocinitomicaceae bacterium]